jgi:hypothetical protein
MEKNFRELAASVVYPYSQFSDRMLTFFAGTSAKAEQWSLSFLLVYSGSGTPHYFIFDETVHQYGWGGVRSAGFFDFMSRLT